MLAPLAENILKKDPDFFGAYLPASPHALRARCIVLDIFDPLHRMTPQWMTTQDHVASQTSRHRRHEGRANAGLNRVERSLPKESFREIVRKFRGRRLEGSTVGDFGRGLDVPPGFERLVSSSGAIVERFVGLFSAIFMLDDAGVFFREGGRRVESRRFASWCETLWHDALSDVVPTSANGESFLIGPWNCCVTCRASRW
jgi:hypothetical protein